MGRDNSEIDSVMFFGIRNHNYRTLQVFESKTILVHNTGTLLMIMLFTTSVWLDNFLLKQLHSWKYE